MKTIKKYNQFISESLIHQINHSDFHEGFLRERESFLEREIREIRKMGLTPIARNHDVIEIVNQKTKDKSSKYPTIVSVFKRTDYWFYCIIKNTSLIQYADIVTTYHKCDTFEGLLELLHDQFRI